MKHIFTAYNSLTYNLSNNLQFKNFLRIIKLWSILKFILLIRLSNYRPKSKLAVTSYCYRLFLIQLIVSFTFIKSNIFKSLDCTTYIKKIIIKK